MSFYSKATFLFLICHPASSYTPSSQPSPKRTFISRPRTSLNYVSSSAFHDPASVIDDDAAIKRHRHRNKKKAGTSTKYELHSNNVSELTLSSTYDDVRAAMKRAQNRHDVHDVRIIADFLLEGTPDSFAYGYKGRLLSRLVVVALRLGEVDVAHRAIAMRRERFASSLTPFESAAIIRGLLRLHRSKEAFELLGAELPLHGRSEGAADRLKHRALALSSIASRYLFERKSNIALRACLMLAEVGSIISQQHADVLTPQELDMPWHRILAGADECAKETSRNDIDRAVVGAIEEFPLDNKMKAILHNLSA